MAHLWAVGDIVHWKTSPVLCLASFVSTGHMAMNADPLKLGSDVFHLRGTIVGPLILRCMHGRELPHPCLKNGCGTSASDTRANVRGATTHPCRHATNYLQQRNVTSGNLGSRLLHGGGQTRLKGERQRAGQSFVRP